MKIIKVPETVTLTNRINGQKGQTISFRDYAFANWLNDTSVAKNFTEIHEWMKVVDKFEKIEPGDEILLENSEHKKLVEVVNKMPTMETPLVVAQLLPYAEAVLEAKEPAAPKKK